MIPFNKPFICGNELLYIQQTLESGHISGNGIFTDKCHHFFEERFGFNKVLLTQSCTDALEMAALLLNIQPEDEIIIPSFTFVSAANAFLLRGATIVFADSNSDEPNLNIDLIADLITPRTKVIVAAHYGGVSIDMLPLLDLAVQHNIYIVEDAASCIGSRYRGAMVGSIGHLSTFSFHETKNISSGEGGMLVINDERLIQRAEIIWEKGTNRAAFSRGEVARYDWMDIGSSFLPSEITAAWLYAQTEHFDEIMLMRKLQWEQYSIQLAHLAAKGCFTMLKIPDYADHNYHVFSILCKTIDERTALICHLKDSGIMAVYHYQALHRSSFYSGADRGLEMPNSERFSDTLLRLPLYFNLSAKEIGEICAAIEAFYL